MPVTQKDIARKAGVNTSTVSRALASDPRISKVVREQIAKIAEELGYRRNPFISALMSNRRSRKGENLQGCLALVEGVGKFPKWRKPLEKVPWVQGLKRRAERRGFMVQYFSMADLSGNALARILKTRGIRGIVLSPGPQTYLGKDFPHDNFACVVVGFEYGYPGLDTVRSHSLTAIETAVTQFLKRGYRRFGFVDIANRQKILEFEEYGSLQIVATRSSIPIETAYLLQDKWNVSEALDWIAEEKPEVLFTPNLKVIEAIKANGARFPKDICVVRMEGWGRHGFSRIYSNLEAQGEVAANTLIDLLMSHSIGIPRNRRLILLHKVFEEATSASSNPVPWSTAARPATSPDHPPSRPAAKTATPPEFSEQVR